MLSRFRSASATRVPVERWLASVGFRFGPLFLGLHFTSAGVWFGLRIR